MEPEKLLEYARRLLAIREDIVVLTMRQRNRVSSDFIERSERVTMCKQRVAEAEAKIRALRPPKPVDPAKHREDHNRQVMAKIEAEANVRSAVENRLRTLASQAALDRAAFVEQVKRDLPEEAWAETIDEYDRRVYESRIGGSQ